MELLVGSPLETAASTAIGQPDAWQYVGKLSWKVGYWPLRTWMALWITRLHHLA
jgi:hypothetical protein